jgi:hypothetical protein
MHYIEGFVRHMTALKRKIHIHRYYQLNFRFLMLYNTFLNYICCTTISSMPLAVRQSKKEGANTRALRDGNFDFAEYDGI